MEKEKAGLIKKGSYPIRAHFLQNTVSQMYIITLELCGCWCGVSCSTALVQTFTAPRGFSLITLLKLPSIYQSFHLSWEISHLLQCLGPNSPLSDNVSRWHWWSPNTLVNVQFSVNSDETFMLSYICNTCTLFLLSHHLVQMSVVLDTRISLSCTLC